MIVHQTNCSNNCTLMSCLPKKLDNRKCMITPYTVLDTLCTMQTPNCRACNSTALISTANPQLVISQLLTSAANTWISMT